MPSSLGVAGEKWERMGNNTRGGENKKFVIARFMRATDFGAATNWVTRTLRAG